MKISQFTLIAIFWVFVTITGCQSIKQTLAGNSINRSFKKSEIFTNQFTGFLLYDPQSNVYLKEWNADLNFTPASNTKIFTTAACLQVFGDSIPTYDLAHIDSVVHIEPYGDPTLLHPDFPEQPALYPLMGTPTVVHLPERPIKAFGPGWAWDDYQYSFQSERFWMPIYANEVRIFNSDTLHVIPDFFEDYIDLYVGERPGSFVYREFAYNLFNIWMEDDSSSFERKIPFQVSNELLSILMADTIGASTTTTNSPLLVKEKTVYNQATIPTLALMMQRSDNFLAEQLLITAGRAKGYENQDAFRNRLLHAWQLSDQLQWVDGSGLSRYNLFTPRAIVKVLNYIYREVDWQTIQWIFPNGGKSGTIKNWYPGIDQPYVFAKTGTLSNNHCLSGFIVTNSGRKLIFSFMNNNYLTPVNEVKAEMQKVLEKIRDNY
ncbi:D-alanyl-D-alanine carboxypeptidase [Marinoscillum sp.]|uniref:D-alanyl-D-alanine carboxypeptidase n=1 Tax=Marinoscillum sp. TaxID=2024838 RepID=UPI003BAD8F4B